MEDVLSAVLGEMGLNGTDVSVIGIISGVVSYLTQQIKKVTQISGPKVLLLVSALALLLILAYMGRHVLGVAFTAVVMWIASIGLAERTHQITDLLKGGDKAANPPTELKETEAIPERKDVKPLIRKETP